MVNFLPDIYNNSTQNTSVPVPQPAQQSNTPIVTFNPSAITGKAATAINNFGSGVGFGGTQPLYSGFGSNATVVGTAPTGVSGGITSVPLTGVLQGAGIGGIVGALNPLAKGSPAGGVGGSIGGAIAAGAGFGPIGMAVGGLLGSSIGGLFGNKKPGVHASEFQTQTQKGNDFNSVVGWGSKRSDNSAAQSVHSDFTSYLNDIGTKYGASFDDTMFRGGYNDLYGGGWFLTAKKNSAGGTIEADPNSWSNYNFNPDAPDKYNTYAKVAADLLASKGLLTQDIATQLINDARERTNQANIGGTGGSPQIPVQKQSDKESFDQFVQRYRKGELDQGMVTAQRTLPQDDKLKQVDTTYGG